jgi:putative exosortase-associated protein (TIGR04073 family)
MKAKRFTLLLLALAVFAAAACSVKQQQPNYVEKGGSYGDKAARKLSRGVTNIFSSPLEIPNQMADQAIEGDSTMEQLSGYLGGVFVGCFYGMARAVSGAYDVVTFPAPSLDKNGLRDEFIHSEFLDDVEEREDYIDTFVLDVYDY